jgi:hypothetical protein
MRWKQLDVAQNPLYVIRVGSLARVLTVCLQDPPGAQPTRRVYVRSRRERFPSILPARVVEEALRGATTPPAGCSPTRAYATRRM